MKSLATAGAVLALLIPSMVAAQAYDAPSRFGGGSPTLPNGPGAPPGQAASGYSILDGTLNAPGNHPSSGAYDLNGPGGRAAGAAYRRWSRGQVLPPEARTTPIANYDQLHLRHPPRGYDWYRCGDQMVLASTDSGLIFEVIDGD